jgi:hypothetical protein
VFFHTGFVGWVFLLPFLQAPFCISVAPIWWVPCLSLELSRTFLTCFLTDFSRFDVWQSHQFFRSEEL